MNTIIIEIEGGNLASILATENIKVILIDRDNQKTGQTEFYAEYIPGLISEHPTKWDAEPELKAFIEGVKGHFIHPEIESDLLSLDNNQSYNYEIEQTSNSPENFRLTITEADTDLEYNYDYKGEAEKDIETAKRIFNLELINTSL